MQNAKYKKQKQSYHKKLLIVGILLVIMLLLLAILSELKVTKKEKEEALQLGKFSSIEDVLKYYDCQLRKVKTRTEDNLGTDINCVFSHELYDGEQSNEEFFTKLIYDMAKFLNFNNFRLLDESRNEPIEIRVMGDKSRIKTILINGIEDYFIYMDSQIDLKKYQELKITELSVQAEELQNCIHNGWSTDTNFGTRETIFQNYFVYFDEGIKTRKISGKIYNIVFTNNYVKSVVNGFTVGEKHDIIISELGTPTFQTQDGSIIGYKSKDFYVFFEENQISIYRNTEEKGFDEFFQLVDQFLQNDVTLLEFMNRLTDLWPDYEKYEYDAETIFLSYPNKGIDVKMNYDALNGIVVYNNIGVSQELVNQYLEHTEFIARLQLDNVFQAEQRRVLAEKNLEALCEKYQAEQEAEDTRNRGQKYQYYMEMSEDETIMTAYFISQNPEFPNCELSENIQSYIWQNDHCFIYSIENKGIYYYDLDTQTKGVILTGEGTFEIKSYQNQQLQYDDQQIEF